MRQRCLGFLVGLLLLWSQGSHADLDCDGIDDLLTTGLALSVFHTSTDATAMLWVMTGSGGPTGAGCWNAPLYLSDTESVWALAQQPTGTVCGFLYDTTETNRIVTNPSTVGTWYHLALTLGGGTVTLYVNGASVGSQATSPFFSLTGLLHVCGLPAAVTPVAARVADIKVYNVAVPASEIATLGGSRQRYTGRSTPTAHWPLSQCAEGSSGQGVGFVDRSGNGRVLTGDDGTNNTGLACRASERLRLPWGPH